MKERQVYLPEGTKWVDAYTKQTYEGGQVITTPTPLEVIPVMMREGKNYSIYEV